MATSPFGTASSSAHNEDRWGWCRPRKATMPPVADEEALAVARAKQFSTLGSQSLLGSEPPLLINETRCRHGLNFGGPGTGPSEAGPFHGVARDSGATKNRGRIRGGRLAAESWAGTHPLKGSGISDGRVICDGARFRRNKES